MGPPRPRALHRLTGAKPCEPPPQHHQSSSVAWPRLVRIVVLIVSAIPIFGALMAFLPHGTISISLPEPVRPSTLSVWAAVDIT